MKKLLFYFILVSMFASCPTLWAQDDISHARPKPSLKDAKLIDSEKFEFIKRKFNIETINNVSFGAYLGGLKPKYNMSSALIISTEDNGLYPVDCGNRTKMMLVVDVRENGNYDLVKTHQRLRQLFAPITSSNEAISFAHLYEGGLPASAYKKTHPSFEEISKIKTVESAGNDRYTVKLLVSDPCDIHGELSICTYLVRQDGAIEKIDTQALEHRSY